MTTLAYDGITLAADSQVIAGDLRFGKINKIIKLKDGRRFAHSGDLAFAFYVAAWLNGGEKPVKAEGEHTCGIIVSQSRVATELNSNLRLMPACVPWAGGTGEALALMAMMCGKTAEEAVALACELDKNSGLPVNVFRPKPCRRR